MAEATVVRVPMEFVNDVTVQLVHRHVDEGEEAREGQALADVETSKAVLEIASPASGPVRWAVRLGEEVAVGGVLCYIGAGEIAEPSRSAPSAAAAESARGAVPGTRFSKKALELLERHGIDPAVFAGRTLVREQDVEEQARLAQAPAAEATRWHAGFRELPLAGVTLPAGWESLERGKVEAGFLREITADLDRFAELSSTEKIEAYRAHGAVVGEGVVLGRGAVIVAPHVVLEDRVSLGDRADVRCRERFVAGALSSFGAGLSVRGGSVVLGSNVYGGKNVEIGGGGHADPWSLLSVGDTTFVGDDVFINICRPVVLGKEVFLTQRTVLVTHNIGHSVLEGYENRFAPIVLEDFAQVGMNCTLYAGSRVGRAAIVASNSYVISSIPEGKLAMGVPARVVRDAARPPDRARQIAMVHRMLEDFADLLRGKGQEVSQSTAAPRGFTLSVDGKIYRLAFVEALGRDAPPAEPGDESVLWTLERGAAALPDRWTVIDLLAKRIEGPEGRFVDSTREFLRKRGIRCQPGPWRYRGGLI